MLFVSNLGDVILLKNQKKNIIKGQRIFRFCGLSIKKIIQEFMYFHEK